LFQELLLEEPNLLKERLWEINHFNDPFKDALQLSCRTNLSSIKGVRHLSYAENATRFIEDLVE